ncbi:MAG: hypothetical protein RLZZ626_325 [Actinomycetota bacterium]|jgi:hypothetical protein
MLDWLSLTQSAVVGAVALFTLILGLANRKPSGLSISAFALVATCALLQLVASIVLIAGGQQAATNTVEFVIYVVVSLLVPLLAGFWALVERTRFSTFVMAIAAVTYLVMLLREQQLWFGAV